MYENYYHLRSKPFRLSPDPGFFFESRGHKRALAYLRYGLSQAEGFVVVTGAPGTGKTTLAQILLQGMNQSEVVVAHLTTTQLEADEMLRMVAASYGLRYEGQDKAGLLKNLEAFFIARSRERKRVLLVVDEAQNLPARSLEELRMLSNLQVGGQALLQTFLLGQVQFRQKLDHPSLEQLRQRVIANYHLCSLGADECQSYIESRLKHVGWKNDPRFTEDAYKIIFDHTEGVPRRINMLCDRILLLSSLEERHEINAALLLEVTNELQSEISGMPIPKLELDSDTSPDVPSLTEARVSPKFIADEQIEKAKEAAPTTGDEPERMHNAAPDDGGNQVRAQAQRDELEPDDDNGVAPKEKERFRVISGGKDSAHKITEASTHPANYPDSEVLSPIPDASDDSQQIVLRKILRLVLAFHRSPRSFPGLDDPTQLLPKGITAILELATEDDQVLLDFRQISVMGISPTMLRAAVRFFVRRVLFLPGGGDLRILGLTSSAVLADVEIHYGLLMKLLRQDNKDNETAGVTRIGEAYERLCRSDMAELEAENSPLGDEDNREELDLDLAPNLLVRNPGLRGVSVDTADITEGEERTKTGVRNLLLISGAIVIVFAVYLTQMTGVEETSPGMLIEAVDELALSEIAMVERSLSEAVDELALSEIAMVEQSLSEPVAEEPQILVATNDDTSSHDFSADVETVEQEPAEEVEDAENVEELVATAEQAVEKAAQLQVRVDRILGELATLRQADAEAKAEANAKAKVDARAKADAKAKANVTAKADVKVGVAELAAQAEVIAPAALAKHISSFETAYQAGDINRFSSLFAATVHTNDQVNLSGLRREYQDFFKNSSKRKIQLKSLRWEHKENYVRGIGEYDTTMLRKGERSAYQEKGKVILQLENRLGKLQITRFYFSETVTTDVPVASKGPGADAHIEKTELNGLIKRLIADYAAGDIERFMSLFSKDAQTNDRATLKGIREDYVGLFNNTLSRKISFTDFQWKQDGNSVRGESDYKVDVQVGENSGIDHYQGQVWIQVARKNGKARITHFAFSE